MRCKSCGYENGSSEILCTSCGDPLHAAVAPGARRLNHYGEESHDQLRPRRIEGAEPVSKGERRVTAGTRGTGGVAGQVSGSSQRNEDKVTTWSFRVDVYDDSGNLLRRIPVEMRGLAFEGSIKDGDIVEVPGSHREGTTMRPPWVMNHSTGAPVRPKGLTEAVGDNLKAMGLPTPLAKAIKIFIVAVPLLAFVIILSAFIWIAGQGYGMFGQGAPLDPCAGKVGELEFAKKTLMDLKTKADTDTAGRQFWREQAMGQQAKVQRIERELQDCRQAGAKR
jgi:hypothetical protein